MAQPTTVDEFIDLVRKSGVADEKRLDAYLAKMRASLPPEPAKAAGLLVQDGLLTHFQAENILQGKWRRFSIGKYKVLERLGSGGFAQVYLCEHKLMRRRVAVKVLPVAKAKDSSALQRFQREARAVAALDHPNIVHAYDIDQDGDLHFLVMEYVDGANLLEIVQASGPLSVLRACHYIQQAALGMQHAHESNLVHRDIKPGNILVDRTGLVKLLDLGLALSFAEEDEQLTKKHDDGTLGTADYLSPEQAMDSHDVDIRTDIYSLGVTFYFLLTGRAPFEGLQVAQKLLAHQMKQPRPISEYRKDVPAGVLAIIDKMMAKKVENRFATPGDVADALAPFTQTPIDPPADKEMPHLSMAATGHAPGAEARSDANARPAAARQATPPSGTRKAKSVSQPAAEPYMEIPAAAQVPKQTEERAPWQENETPEPADSPEFAAPLPGRRKPLPAESRRTTLLIVVLVLAFGVIPLCLTGTIGGVIWYFSSPAKTIEKRGPRRFEVSKDPANTNAVRSIQSAIRQAETGSVIELLDDLYEENVVIDPVQKRTAFTLQAAEGKLITWRSARKDPETPILRLHKAAKFQFKGKGITLDGTLDKGRYLNEIIKIELEAAGLILDDLHLKNYARSGIFIMNAGGASNAPIRLSRLTFSTVAPQKTRGAIFFDANPKVLPPQNDYIDIEDADFRGYDRAKAVQVAPTKNQPINGKNVRW
ncbi:MAG: protein kinase [Planctomycetes bacterium]|nr:protein kinase [Planctomycetota bacterium]